MRTVLIWAVTAFVAISAQKVSTNGRCGPQHGNRVCTRSSYGDCCSQYGWCGSTPDHCKTGCKPFFGICSGPASSSTARSSTLRTSTILSTRTSPIAPSSTRTSSTANASPSIRVSQDRRCGYLNGAKDGFTCTGSAFGNCCSEYSYCGSTSAYCKSGCQPGFGTCSGISSSVRSSSTQSALSSSAQINPSVPSSSSSTSSRTSSSLLLSTTVSSSSIYRSTSTSSSATSQSTIPSSSSPSPSVPLMSSASSSSILVSVASSPAPSPTPIIENPVQVVVNPSFELGDGSDPTAWTVERLYVIDAGATGRVQSNPRTGSYSIRGRGFPSGGYDVYLSQTVTVVPGASYNIEVFAKQTTFGFCSISIYLDDGAIREFVAPGTSYTSIAAVVNIPQGGPVQHTLLVDGACSLPGGNTETYDLFIDDVTMTLVI